MCTWTFLHGIPWCILGILWCILGTGDSFLWRACITLGQLCCRRTGGRVFLYPLLLILPLLYCATPLLYCATPLLRCLTHLIDSKYHLGHLSRWNNYHEPTFTCELPTLFKDHTIFGLIKCTRRGYNIYCHNLFLFWITLFLHHIMIFNNATLFENMNANQIHEGQDKKQMLLQWQSMNMTCHLKLACTCIYFMALATLRWKRLYLK